jgi:circadian clock protein KaiB
MCASENIINTDSVSQTEKAWRFVIYIMGSSPRSVRVRENLERICQERSITDYIIEAIDVSKEPHRGAEDQIIALPTVIRKFPQPERRVVGDLSDITAVLEGLEL